MATLPQWTSRPNYTPEQIRARYGPNAVIVRAGNGKFTVKGADPERLGAVGPGGPYNTGTPVTPGVAAPGAPPAPGAGVPPLPVSLGFESQIQGINDQIGSLPGVYDPQRLALYASGARGLTDQGLYDLATADVAQAGPAGTSYTVRGIGQGAAYRDQFGQIYAANNARGTLYGTAARQQKNQAERGLNNTRDAIIRGLGQSQDQITREQAQQRIALGQALGQTQADYADYRAQQLAPVPPAPTAPAAQAVRVVTSKPKTKPKPPNYFAGVRRARAYFARR